MNIFLYGPSGSGKSTVGKLLAHRLGRVWFDLDDEIEKQIGTSLEVFFTTQGESSFREIESSTLNQVLIKNPSAVISLGGGTLLNDQNRFAAENSGQVVVLSANLEVLLARLLADNHARPLIKADPRQSFTALLERRQSHYASFRESIHTDHQTADEIVHELQIKLGFFHISGMGSSYDVLIAPGSLDNLGAALQERNIKGPAALVCDQNVNPIYSGRAMASLKACGIETTKFVIPVGEEHKTLQTINSLWSGFVQAGVERKSIVIALGGGITGDLTGFAAATYLRGIPWVNVPTTLLAMVDSSLGGKTGANLPQGKNLIGAFHAPALVLTDPEELSSLPPAELRSGLAEAIKHALIADPSLYQQLRNEGWGQEIEKITSLISRAVAVKAAVIESDPYEKGARQALNFGHTAGHGIERASDYHLSHGESVAIGMVVETRLAEKIGLAQSGLADEIASTLIKLGLPAFVPPEIDRDAIIKAMRLDKKRSDKQIHFALPESIGKMRSGVVINNWEVLIEL